MDPKTDYTFCCPKNLTPNQPVIILLVHDNNPEFTKQFESKPYILIGQQKLEFVGSGLKEKQLSLHDLCCMRKNVLKVDTNVVIC